MKNIAIIGEAGREYTNALSEEYEIFILPADPLLAPEVSGHADMILTVIADKLYCHKSYYVNNKVLLDTIAAKAELTVVASNCRRSAEYPENIAFNVLTAGDHIIGKKDSVCPEIEKLGIINTNQGYAGCTSLFAAGHIISADPSTLKAAESANIPTCRISGNDIELSGYDRGFIGGACGVFEDKVYIVGSPEHSQSARELEAFCRPHGLQLVSLYDSIARDIGGIKFLAVH